MCPLKAEAPPPTQDDLLRFVVEASNERIMVFDAAMSIAFCNEKAGKFIDRHALPAEVLALVGRVHTAIGRGKAGEQFVGQICLHRAIGGRNWLFRVAFREGDRPLVGVYFSDETDSGRFDMNVLRRQHRLTRREADVLRHVLDGAKNQEIAEDLGIAEQTVKEYLSNTYRKVGVPDRFSLLRLLRCATQQ